MKCVWDKKAVVEEDVDVDDETRRKVFVRHETSISSTCLLAAFTPAHPKSAKSCMSWLSFCTFGICASKSCALACWWNWLMRSISSTFVLENKMRSIFWHTCICQTANKFVAQLWQILAQFEADFKWQNVGEIEWGNFCRMLFL